MADGELKRVRLRTLTFALFAAAAVLVGTVGPARASNDPLFGKQWGLAQTGAPAAWGRSTGAGVTIGIVDTGVHLSQEDLAGKVVQSTNCIGSGGDAGACSGNAQDDNGHGTHVSGIAAAYKDNGRGIAGVAPDAKLVVAKVLGSNGKASTADVEAGIRWVVQHGAKIVNLSLGDDPIAGQLFSDPAFPQAINDAWNAGAIPVVAGGNRSIIFCNASYGDLNALVVGATGHSGSVAGYSCSLGDAKWGVMAPGGDSSSDPDGVVSTYWDKTNASSTNSYAYLAGTSMATPHVSGLLALLLAEGLPRDAVVQRVLATTVGVPGCSASTCGHGLINVAAAVGTGSGGGTGTGGTGGPPAPPSSGGSPRVVKPPASTAPRAAASTTVAPDGSTTTAPPGTSVQPPAGDNPVVAAAGQPRANSSTGRHSSRAGQVGLAIGLLGVAGLGVSLGILRFRGGAAP